MGHERLVGAAGVAEVLMYVDHRLGPVAGGRDFIAAAQEHAHQLAHVLIVIDDHYLLHPGSVAGLGRGVNTVQSSHMIVMKFGGSSVGAPERIGRVIEIVRGRLARKPVIVVSAFRGVTDDLLELGREALKGNLGRLEDVAKRHRDAARDLGVDAAALEPLLTQLSELARGVSLLKELTPRTLDRLASFGERLSSRIVAAAFSKAGILARAVDASDAGLLTDDHFGEATPLPEADDLLRRALGGPGPLFIVTGFIGKTRGGELTTLGRNGSDFTATIIGAALGAEERR